jgi:hypothetical protein
MLAKQHYSNSHPSNLLQLLDIGHFAVIKQAYDRLIQSKIRYDLDHIDKLDFLACYPDARSQAYNSATGIFNSFASAGLILFNAQHVPDKLTI